jgi:hypothetical protein
VDNALSAVDSFLENDHCDPQITQVYEQTTADFRLLRDGCGHDDHGGGGYPSQRLGADGQINGLYFTFVGQSQYEIESQCQNWGARNGLSWVNNVLVNSRYVTDGRLIPINQACSLVAQNATLR